MKIHRIFIALLFLTLLSSCSKTVENSEGDILVNETLNKELVEFTVDLENLTLLNIGVKENDGEMLDEINERSDNIKYVNVRFSLIESDLYSVLTALDGAMVCTGECTIYGANSDIIITLTDGETIFDIMIDNSGAEIHIRGAYKTSGDNFEFNFSNQYSLEFTRIYNLIVEEYKK